MGTIATELLNATFCRKNKFVINEKGEKVKEGGVFSAGATTADVLRNAIVGAFFAFVY